MKKMMTVVFVMAVVGCMLLSCHKEEENPNPGPDYRDQYEGTYFGTYFGTKWHNKKWPGLDTSFYFFDDTTYALKRDDSLMVIYTVKGDRSFCAPQFYRCQCYPDGHLYDSVIIPCDSGFFFTSDSLIQDYCIYTTRGQVDCTYRFEAKISNRVPDSIRAIVDEHYAH